jgi:hypothetical protein
MTEKNILFRLKRIQEDEFSYNNLEFSRVNFDIKHLKIATSLGLDSNVEENSFTVFLSIRYHYKSGKKQIEVIKLSFFVEYEIKEMKELFTEEKDFIELPDTILGSMVTLAIGTGRGILYSKTGGVSNINELYLPIIDAQALINFYKAENEKKVSG